MVYQTGRLSSGLTLFGESTFDQSWRFSSFLSQEYICLHVSCITGTFAQSTSQTDDRCWALADREWRTVVGIATRRTPSPLICAGPLAMLPEGAVRLSPISYNWHHVLELAWVWYG
jgi:hypothetical protein